jgi:hypothetical protein
MVQIWQFDTSRPRRYSMAPLVAEMVKQVSAETEVPRSVDDRFIGDLSRWDWTEQRGEQKELRQLLLAGRDRALCSLCGMLYPAALLRAAHIKPRSECSDDERRCLGDIAMLACVLGCDSLYELGYLSVDEHGLIEGHRDDLPDDTWRRVDDISGRRCAAFSDRLSPLFAWHRANIARTER